MDENKTTVEEIVDRIDEVIQDLVGFTFLSPVALPASISPDAAARITKFNEYVWFCFLSSGTEPCVCRRLSQIKTSATEHSVTTRNFLQRLLDAERISEELDSTWKDVSLAYDELIVCVLLLSPSCKTDDSI
jgi:hypothetical protein